MKEGGGGGRCGGAKRRRKNNFRPPWNTHGKLKVGGGGAVGRWACSRAATRRERKSGWVIGMLGLRQVTPRWENDLMWQSEILRRRQGTPRSADEPIWWLWLGLGKPEVLEIIHNNKRQSLELEQSLTEAWKNHLIIL